MDQPRDEPQSSLASDVRMVICGLTMGGADAIPGVSGGTVALLLGIYTRLVTAISNFDRQLLRHVRSGEWRAAAKHIDLRFLVTLGVGILVGLVVTLKVIGDLLEGPSRPFVLAAFFGMIVGSCFLVAKLVRIQGRQEAIGAAGLGVLGASVAFAIYWFTTFSKGEALTNDPNYTYLFFCGAIAICAMILPGISGAMVLLLLGVYTHLSHTVKGAAAGQDLQVAMLTVVVFCSGCAVGLLSFSKILKWLLTKFPSQTMATMCGFMFGALPKLWPFDQQQAGGDPAHPHYHPEMPAIDGQTVRVAVVALVAIIVVLAIDWLARRNAERMAAANQTGEA